MSVAIDSADEPPVFLCAASVRVTRLEHVWLIRGTVAASRTLPRCRSGLAGTAEMSVVDTADAVCRDAVPITRLGSCPNQIPRSLGTRIASRIEPGERPGKMIQQLKGFRRGAATPRV